MTREEAEHKIAEKLKEIYKIAYDEYGMTDDYLSLNICEGTIGFNNKSWRDDNLKKLDYFEDLKESEV